MEKNNDVAALLKDILVAQLCIAGVPQTEVAKIAHVSTTRANAIGKPITKARRKARKGTDNG